MYPDAAFFLAFFSRFWRRFCSSALARILNNSMVRPLLPYVNKQVTWLVVTEVQSGSFGLVTERCHEIGVLWAVTRIFAYWTSLTVMNLIFFIVECGIARFLCAMCVFQARASSSSPRLPVFVPNFLWRPLLSQPVQKKGDSVNHSLSHSPSLFDAQEPKLSLRKNIPHIHQQCWRKKSCRQYHHFYEWQSSTKQFWKIHTLQ